MHKILTGRERLFHDSSRSSIVDPPLTYTVCSTKTQRFIGQGMLFTGRQETANEKFNQDNLKHGFKNYQHDQGRNTG